MNFKIFFTLALIFFFSLNFASAISVDADYVTILPGETGAIKINVENNENFDIEEISVALNLENVPFTSVGSSEKDLEDLSEDDDDSISFSLKPFTNIIPGDYNIPYVVKYKEEGTNLTLTKSGSFGLRVSAKTEIDFSVEEKNNILEQKGQISLKIINKGLGEIKFVSVKILPQGFELASGEKVYIGTIDSDDSDFATFDVIFNSNSPSLSAIVEYKDFDNQDQKQTISLPVKVYTKEQALSVGLIKKSKTGFYIFVVAILIIGWIAWRQYKKYLKNKKQKEMNGKWKKV